MRVDKMQPELTFHVQVEWDGSTGGEAKLSVQPPLRFDTPRDFGGSEAGYCPEELFLASLAACLTTTFAYLRPKLGLEASSLRINTTDRVEFRDGGYMVTEAGMKVKLEVKKGQAELARQCVELAAEYCHVTRSIRRCIPVHLEVEVVEV